MNMNPGEKVTVTISPAGKVTIDAEGFEGCGCEEITETVHVMLGGGGETKHKPEYFQAPAANTSQHQRDVF